MYALPPWTAKYSHWMWHFACHAHRFCQSYVISLLEHSVVSLISGQHILANGAKVGGIADYRRRLRPVARLGYPIKLLYSTAASSPAHGP
jgi:hypothetical protein